MCPCADFERVVTGGFVDGGMLQKSTGMRQVNTQRRSLPGRRESRYSAEARVCLG